MRPLPPLLLCVLALACPATAGAYGEGSLPGKLRTHMRSAGAASGTQVLNLTTGKSVYSLRRDRARILASNTKLFTTGAALAQFGADGTLATEVRATGQQLPDGTFEGDLWLVGGGDPSFGSRRFARRAYGTGGAIEDLAVLLERAGMTKVTGRIYGDESRFDTLRGGPDSAFRIDLDVGGPLSALAYNRGLATETGRGFQANPAAFAAARLTAALKARDIPVKGKPKAGKAPSGARILAAEKSPRMRKLIALTNKPSDNYFAETLLKDLALADGVRATTRNGTRAAAAFARRLGSGVTLADGSGLSRQNRTSPARIVRLLSGMQKREDFQAYLSSLSVAGRDGTLRPRMRRGPARGRCRAKTGTIAGVSALSGYCTARSGDLYAFSILMNAANIYTARAVQDRMAQAIAGVQ